MTVLPRLAAVVLVTALRVTVLWRRLPLDEAVARLRRGRRLPEALARPELVAQVVRRLAPLLPPFGIGVCLRRSLLLVHLWSRCGLHPRLQLGLAAAGAPRRRGHAWLEVDDPGLQPLAGADLGHLPAVTL